jgi:hypothetical protein
LLSRVGVDRRIIDKVGAVEAHPHALPIGHSAPRIGVFKTNPIHRFIAMNDFVPKGYISMHQATRCGIAAGYPPREIVPRVWH